jgi:hypothetical protein
MKARAFRYLTWKSFSSQRRNTPQRRIPAIEPGDDYVIMNTSEKPPPRPDRLNRQ